MSLSTTNFKKTSAIYRKQLLKKHAKRSTVSPYQQKNNISDLSKNNFYKNTKKGLRSAPINKKNNISDLSKNNFYKNTKKGLRSSPITKKIVLHPLLRHLLPLKNAQKGLRCASAYPPPTFPTTPHHPQKGLR